MTRLDKLGRLVPDNILTTERRGQPAEGPSLIPQCRCGCTSSSSSHRGAGPVPWPGPAMPRSAEVRYMKVPPGGMEVSDPIDRHVRDAHRSRSFLTISQVRGRARFGNRKSVGSRPWSPSRSSGKFSPPQPSHVGERKDSGPHFPTVALDAFRTLWGRLHQLPEFDRR